MKKFHLLCLRHRVLTFLIGAGFYLALVTYCAVLGEWNPVLIVVVDILLVLFVWLYTRCLPASLTADACREYNNACDPESLRSISELLLTYKLSKINRMTISMNRGTAMRQYGEFQQNLEILTSLNIDQPGCLPTLRFVYYNNLANAYYDVGNLEMAELCRQKARVLYDDFKPGKTKENLRYTMTGLDAESFYRHGDYGAAMATLQAMPTPQNAIQRVELEASWARLLDAMGNHAEACRHWQYVLENGNKLYCVIEARRALYEDAL